MDGHDKFRIAGIQIYGCVDAFSRKVIWIYVGHNSRTQVSVVHQYLKLLLRKRRVAEILRTDHGVETPMMADAHFAIRQDNDHLRDKARSLQIPFRNHAADVEGGRPLTLPDCFYYGPSTKNIAIETWWGRLLDHQLRPWRVRFPVLVMQPLLTYTGLLPRAQDQQSSVK
jgi:hypothetical protein